MRTVALTTLALLAFAGNSVLGRLALGSEAIDPASFTTVRLVAGALMLLAILAVRPTRENRDRPGSPLAGGMLFVYAACFSFAYVSLDTGVGALILFAAVQITIIATSVISGARLQLMEWVGAAVAFGGFVYLLLPGLSAPSLMGAVLMSAAGVAWGFYTLAGSQSTQPLAATGGNFLRALPYAAVLAVITIGQMDMTLTGLVLAVTSGAITSGIGYAVCYLALRDLTSVQAAVVQLFVPIVAAIGGVIFAHETLSPRLMIAAALILGGNLLVTQFKRRQT